MIETKDNYEEVLRRLACELSAGGYNAEILTSEQLYEKVKCGIDEHARMTVVLFQERIREKLKAFKEQFEITQKTLDNPKFATFPFFAAQIDLKSRIKLLEWVLDERHI